MSEATSPINQPDFTDLWSLNDLNPAALGDMDGPDAKAPLSLDQVANVTQLVRELQQHNAQLVRHVKELDAALEKSQANLEQQLHQGHDQELLMMQQLQEMVVAQSHITRLMTELENSHQTAQRQQTLIENLSEQLQHSQEQVALLERECALKQQQCQDQVHLLAQQEDMCTELRSQLQQQRQQTSQFKAALEKCLEKSAAIPLASDSDQPAPSLEIPPVASEFEQPTSASSWFGSSESEPAAPASDGIAGMLQDLPLSMMESYLMKAAPPESEERELTNQALTANLNLSQDLSDSDADFWQNLEKLIETPSLIMPTPAFSEPSDTQETPVDSVAEPHIVHTPGLAPVVSLADDLSLATPYRNAKPAGSTMTVNPPSPLVYPQRGKKLPSLAAVDLPNFPKLTAR